VGAVTTTEENDMNTATEETRSPHTPAPPGRHAVLDEMHVGDVTGAFGTISQHDTAPRRTLRHRLLTLLAIMGPGLVVMIGDNDAGGVATYTQAGQQYGTKLLWTLVLLAPVLYLNQEMVLRLGAVSGVGHGRLILERFGKFWAFFSIGDLFFLNFLTIVTEFIGINLAMGYFGVSKYISVPFATAFMVAIMGTGKFRTWERAMFALIIPLNIIMIPMLFLSHPHVGDTAFHLFVPGFPGGLNSTLLLLITAIVGTTVAPWQLFFQQSNVVDKRITPRWIKYERADTLIGCALVIGGGAILMLVTAFPLAHTAAFNNFTDPGASAASLRHYGHPLLGDLLAIALLELSMIGAVAVNLGSTYTFGDVFRRRHSLHWKPSQAPAFYLAFVASILAAASLVLVPGVPLGTLTVGVQALAGILLPSATVFLLLLCNDKDVLGPWVNSRRRNFFTAIVIWGLILLSLALTAATLFKNISGATLQVGFLIGAAVGAIGGAILWALNRRSRRAHARHAADAGPPEDEESRLAAELGLTMAVDPDATPRQRRRQAKAALEDARNSFRMPPVELLAKPVMSRQRFVGLIVLRGYLLIALILAIVKILETAIK
jgi:NRAMP (natural resistance-associated macrophage protein)-like metal ion transporter